MFEEISARLIGRRTLLLSAVALAAGACAPPGHAPAQPEAAQPPDFESWNREAQGMLSDTLEALQTYEVFHAFRVASADNSGMKMAAGLAWDPPMSTDWDDATHVSRGLQGRAQQLFQAVTTAHLDPSLWREQRDMADATHDLIDLGDALLAYRNRIDALPRGDAASALGLLDTVWTQWDAVAARWGTSRSELVPCAT